MAWVRVVAFKIFQVGGGGSIYTVHDIMSAEYSKSSILKSNVPSLFKTLNRNSFYFKSNVLLRNTIYYLFALKKHIFEKVTLIFIIWIGFSWKFYGHNNFE